MWENKAFPLQVNVRCQFSFMNDTGTGNKIILWKLPSLKFWSFYLVSILKGCHVKISCFIITLLVAVSQLQVCQHFRNCFLGSLLIFTSFSFWIKFFIKMQMLWMKNIKRVTENVSIKPTSQNESEWASLRLYFRWVSWELFSAHPLK